MIIEENYLEIYLTVKIINKTFHLIGLILRVYFK